MGEMDEMLLGSQDNIDFYEESMMNGYEFNRKENDRSDV